MRNLHRAAAIAVVAWALASAGCLGAPAADAPESLAGFAEAPGAEPLPQAASLRGWLDDVSVAPESPALPDAATLDPPAGDFAVVPDTAPLPDAATLEEPCCTWADPVAEIGFDPETFTRPAAARALFPSDGPVSFSLGTGRSSRWTTCVESGESCLSETVEAASSELDGWEHHFVAAFSRCSGCALECASATTDTWLVGEHAFESGALAEGSYEVIVESVEPFVEGFVVDDDAASIVASWSSECLAAGRCEPRGVAASSRPRINARADRAIEIRLSVETAFACPDQGTVSEVAWNLEEGTITPVLYAVEPDPDEVDGCDAAAAPAPVTVERTLTIAAGLLVPGTYAVELDGASVTTLVVR
jgi:hypothetical protein